MISLAYAICHDFAALLHVIMLNVISRYLDYHGSKRTYLFQITDVLEQYSNQNH
jgi:hypothetical protein